MCGRISAVPDESWARSMLPVFPDKRERWVFPGPFWNLSPTGKLGVIRLGTDRTPVVEPMRWGLVSKWAKDVSIGMNCINARSETMADKPAFREAFFKRRCLVPITGFYEWKPGKGEKQPYFVCPAEDGPMVLAGLWESWQEPAGGELHTFSVVTTEAKGPSAEIHHRMPVILEPARWRPWLDLGTQREELMNMCVAKEEGLRIYPVSKRVNKASEDGPELMEEVDATGVGSAQKGQTKSLPLNLFD